MKKLNVLTLFAGITLLLITSCASTPVETPNVATDLSLARTAATDSRTKALEMKANVAVPLIFSEADTVFTQAKQKDTANETETALNGYKDATKLFSNAYNEAKQKKDIALKALETTDKERLVSEEALLSLEAEEKEANNE